MKIVFLDAATLGSDLNLERFSKFGETTLFETTQEHQVVERCLHATIILTNKVVLGKDVLQQLPELKMICVTATGMNNIDHDYAKERNIKVANAVNYSTNSVTQLTFSLVLFFLQDVSYHGKFTREKKWLNYEMFTHYKTVHEIAHKKWGVIGLGNIGKQVARVAKSFGADVSYYSTSGANNDDEFTKIESFDEFLSHNDIITIHAPLNKKTRNLLNKNNLNKLENGAILLNLGRGGIINESDLAALLATNKEIYVGLDVLAEEPMGDSCPLIPFLSDDRLLITPHMAWASFEAREELLRQIEEHIQRYLSL